MLHQTIKDLQADVVLCKWSLASGGGNTSNHGLKLDVPKLSTFMGKQEARAVDDFLRQYGDIERGTTTSDTWVEFMADFKKKFYLENDKDDPKSWLRKLKSLYGIAHAEALIDFSTRSDSSKPKYRKVNHEKAPIDGIKVHALVDFGATHNFVAFDEGKRLRINATKRSGTIKAGMIDSSMVSMDDFTVVLELEFINKVRAFPMSFANSLCIQDGGKTCMVSMEQDAKSEEKTLSSMQFKKGFNKNKPFYLAVTRLETNKGLSKVEVPKVIERVLYEFKDVMLKKLPPRREVNHTIKLETGSKAFEAPYRRPPPELKELRKQLKELMNAEYRALNKITIKNKYLIPLIADLFDQLGKARYFTKLDLRSGYYQVRIAKGDEAKTTCLMSHTLEEHVLHLKHVFQVLPDNKLYVKLKKCSFAQEEVEFLGHKIKDGGLMMDGAKIKAIQDWEPSTKVTELRHFLTLVNCYQRLYYWRSSDAKRTPDRIRELKVKFMIKTDNIAKSYFQTQKKLSPKQAHWQDFLAKFDYQLEYKKGKANVVAEALSSKKIIALAKDGKTRRFWLKADMLFTKGDRLHVLKWGDLRRVILKECHDSKWAGHPRIKRTLALVEGTYYWPRIKDDVETFIRTCLIFQQDKIKQKKSRGLLDPLPTPKGPWESVSMDFITCLPKSEGSGSIIVVADRFLKYGTFIAAPPNVTTNDMAKLFFKNVVNYWGVQHVIVSDRDSRLTGRFWTELFMIMETDLNFFTSFHPQTNRQTEKVNALLELYLWHYSEATGKSPFELFTGHQPLTPNTLAASYEGTAKKMKKWADEKRRHVEFEVGDQVMVKLLPQQFKSLRKMHQGLIRRYEGPFLVTKHVGKVSYGAQLPPKLKIRPVFHVSFLKPYHEDEEDPKRGVSKRAPTSVVTSYDREVEDILSGRMIQRRGVPSYKEYLIKWRDLLDSEASWEAEDLLW
uniref:Reverse transcriptase domain-containing protein n=1 Tax=Tanacetum cinerariifolium TaxID=118510 RepID=A0A6L2MBI0_TANCI|nr:hypothetical protein VITISV_029702 [Tanacetum cinerariifolium]